MERFEQPLSALGRHIAELQDETGPTDLDRQRARQRWRALLAQNDESPRSAWASRRRAVAFAALATAAAAAFVWWRPASPLSFTVRGVPSQAGTWLAAYNEEIPIRFSDGSQLTLAPGGRARISSVSADGANIALERGGLRLDIVARDRGQWAVRTGPYAVQVTGTRFDAQWDPGHAELHVALFEGRVVVSGPVIGPSHLMRAGERLTVSALRGSFKVTAIEAPTASEIKTSTVEAIAPEAAEPANAAAAAATRRDRSRAPEKRHPAPLALPRQSTARPDWVALLAANRYDDALLAAELQGIDRICQTASAADLSQLGNAARWARDRARVHLVYTSIRQRFPGTPHAATAAFMLGRAAQLDTSHADTAAWFERYLQEAPSGSFAAEAAGRLIEAHINQHDIDTARVAATRYLEQFPEGPHRGYARRILNAAGAEP